MTHPDEQQRGRRYRDDRTADDAAWDADDDFEDYGFDADDATPADDDPRDGAVAQSTPAQDGASGADRGGLVLMGVLVVFALAASIIMLFTSSTNWMKIAVLAGLWAAVIGAVLTTRYRRQLTAERDRIAELERLHRVELEKEETTHREQELILEQNYLDSLDAERDETLNSLRAEIAALREQLMELTGEDPDERVALRARAERLRELGSASESAPQGGPLRDPEGFDRPAPRARAHRAAASADGTVGAHTQHGPHGIRRRAGRADEPVDVPEVNTGSFRAVRWKPSERADAEPPRRGSHRAPETGRDDADSAASQPPAAERGAHDRSGVRRPSVDGGRRPAQGTASSRPSGADETDIMVVVPDEQQPRGRHGARAQEAEDAQQAQSEPKPEPKKARPEPAPQPPQPRARPAAPTRPAADDAAEAPATARAARDPRGRRRAEDHADGLTVAELLAQMRAKDGDR